METNNTKRILVTGCLGLLGANLCHWLLKNTNDEIYGLDDFSGGNISSKPPVSERFIFFIETVLNASGINGIFEVVKPTHCFHFACYAAEGRSNYIRNFIHTNNTVGTANIINACVNYNCKLIFTSSVAVYSGQPPYTENTQPRPLDSYGVSKYCSEMDIQIAGEQQGLDWCILRPRNCYGVHQSLFDECRNVMGIWMYQIRNDQPMTIFGEGENKRCFTYIEDILQPMYKAIKISKEIINLGSPIPYSIMEANKILQKITGYKNIIYLEPRHEVGEAVCEIFKSQLLLRYEHRTFLKEGLIKMWNWARNIPMRERQKPPPLEIKINTHSSIK